MAELLVHPVAKSLTRRHMVLGGERGLVFTSLLVTAIFVLLALYHALIWLVIPTVGMQLIALAIFRMMAHRDPYLAHVYWRRVWKYQRTYPPLPIPSKYA